MNPIKWYEKFVLENQGMLQSIENISRFGATFYINPEHEVRSEASYTVINVFSLVNQHFIEKDTRSKNPQLRYHSDPRLKVYHDTSFLLKFIDHVQVLIEMMISPQAYGYHRVPKKFLVSLREQLGVLSKDYETIKKASSSSRSFKPSSTTLSRTNNDDILLSTEELKNQSNLILGDSTMPSSALIDEKRQKLDDVQTHVNHLEFERHHFHKQKFYKWCCILGLESVKSLIKLYTIWKSPIHAYLHYSILPQEEDLQREIHPDHLHGTRTNMLLPQHPLSQLLLHRSFNDMFNPHNMRDTSKLSLKKMLFILGEIGHVLRPVIYVLMLMRFTRQSWIPFLGSLIIESCTKMMTNFALTNHLFGHRATGGIASKKRIQRFGKLLDIEYERRSSNLLYYLIRNPLFSWLLRPIVEAISRKLKNVPLLSTLLTNILEYMLEIQNYYFYSSAS
mmetsp:Transcript_6157/g.8959  ORF Transcript_6157/g.8959 Transcript_6157/m.8959 type:complete len:449 (-) Transcript_6157:1321-2667(-)